MKAKFFLLRDRRYLKDSICNCHSWCYTTERKKDPQEIHENCQSHELPSEHRDGIVRSTDWGKDTKKRKTNCHAEGSRDHNGLNRSDMDNQDSSQSWPPHQIEQSGQKDLCVWDKLEPKGSRWLCKSVSEGQHAPSKLPAARKEGQNSSVREHSKAYYCQPEKPELIKNHWKLCVRARGRGSTVPPPPAQVGCCMT